jgi:hypothetical protein
LRVQDQPGLHDQNKKTTLKKKKKEKNSTKLGSIYMQKRSQEDSTDQSHEIAKLAVGKLKCDAKPRRASEEGSEKGTLCPGSTRAQLLSSEAHGQTQTVTHNDRLYK